MRALVIDDSKPVRSILERMFRECGFDVTLASDGCEALERLADGELPDVVTVNWNMPVLDGVDFLHAVRNDARYRHLRVIMVSVESNPRKISEAMRSGADDYLIKPLTKEILLGSLKRLGVPLAGNPVTPRTAAVRKIAPTPRQTRRKWRVLVVDDSVVIRRTLTKVLDDDPEIEVVGTAADGRIALDKLPQVTPDLVLLDVEMPNMDGLQMLAQLRNSHPQLPVIMFSSLTERGAAATLDALMLGANDYVPKPTNVNSFEVAKQCIRDELIPRIKQFAGLRRPVAERFTPISPETRVSDAARRTARVEVIVVGVSTGGPVALSQLLPAIVPGCPVPIVVVQHMPPVFTRHLADRLAQGGRLRVTEGRDEQPLRPGEVVIAPGGSHVVLTRHGHGLKIKLTGDPPENSCRPAADVLFRSAAAVCGSAVLAVVLTGMGKDGLRGCQSIVRAGGGVLAQDQASSVVWGMPGQVVQAGLADEVLPLDRLAASIVRRVAVERGARHELP